MTDLNLNLNELKLIISLVEKRDPDWVSYDLRITVPNFQGWLRWHALRSELAQFATKLETMHANFPTINYLAFEGVEPNIKLIFELKQSGQISGHYSFNPDFARASELRGVFSIDQSYLLELANNIHDFLSSDQEVS